MTQGYQQLTLKIFEGRQIRTAWNPDNEKYYFSIVDIIQVLTENDYQAARKYWKVLKGRLIKEGNQTVTNCYQLKMPASDSKQRLTDVNILTKAWSGMTTGEYKQY